MLAYAHGELERENSTQKTEELLFTVSHLTLTKPEAGRILLPAPCNPAPTSLKKLSLGG